MLTAFQVDVVAYMGDGEVYCPDCVPSDQDCTDNAMIRYSAEESWPEGLNCGECHAEIVEPSEDYCQEHMAWRVWDADGAGNYCDAGEGDCRFPDDLDTNPPVPRWVPCGSCGARDGEPHRDACSKLHE